MPFIMIRPQYDTTLYIDDYAKTTVKQLRYALRNLKEPIAVGMKKADMIEVIENHEVDKALDVEMCICRRCGFQARRPSKFDGAPEDFSAHEQILRRCKDNCENSPPPQNQKKPVSPDNTEEE